MHDHLTRLCRDAWARRHRLRRRRTVALLVAPGLAALLVATLLPGHRSDDWTPQAKRPVKVRNASTSPGEPFTLVTGHTVRMTPVANGRAVVSVTPPRPDRQSPTGMVHTFHVGGDVYSVPDSALPYLRTLLDPRLFDVSYLQRAGYADLDALPVSVQWRKGRHSDVPGLSSARTGTTTTGSLSATSASEFGRALADLSRATLGHGRVAPSPAAKALSQVRKITLAPLPQAEPRNEPGLAGVPGVPDQQPVESVAPAAPLSSNSAPAGTKLYTLTVNPVDRSGNPGIALVYVQNLKSLDTYYSVNIAFPGDSVAVSVPAGPYGVEAFVWEVDPDTSFPENVAFVPVPQVDVTHDTAVTVDAREAEPVEVSVPDKDAAPAEAVLQFERGSADGNGLVDFVSVYGPGMAGFVPPVHLFAKPTPAPRLGSLGFAQSWELVPFDSGLGGDVPYAYSLDFASADGVPATLSHTLGRDDLATVHNDFAANDLGAIYFLVPFHGWTSYAPTLTPTFDYFPTPTRRTEYFGGSGDTTWVSSVDLGSFGDNEAVVMVTGPYRSFRPGEEQSVTWGASPSVPAPEWQDRGLPPGASAFGNPKRTYSYVCAVCRQDDLMMFNVSMSGDGDPTHTRSWHGLGSGRLAGTPDQSTDVVRFYRDGKLTQLDGGSGQVFPMLPGRADYTIDWTSTTPERGARLSTQVRSVWTFTSKRPQKADRLPDYQLCAPDSTRDCSYVPLVFASYDFGADLAGQVAAPGAHTFTVTGYHQPGEAAPQVSKATVEVSFDGGATWSPAAVTGLGGGRFRVSVEQPDPSLTNGYASVRVTLADTAGNALEQTIARAYALSGPAADGASPSARVPR